MLTFRFENLETGKVEYIDAFTEIEALKILRNQGKFGDVLWSQERYTLAGMQRREGLCVDTRSRAGAA